MVITGSTRQGRVGDQIARWLADLARQCGELDVDEADLRDVGLPLLDEPEHPSLGAYTQLHTRRWSHRVRAADAFALVTPEYNWSYPGSLKNALDFLYREWNGKPVSVVSYGGVSAGTRAATALLPVLSSLQMRPVGAVHIPWPANSDGALFAPAPGLNAAARGVLAELADAVPRRTERLGATC